MTPEELHALERIFAMACLTVILVVCLCYGIDHVIVAVIASLIGALAGAKVEWIRDFLNR